MTLSCNLCQDLGQSFFCQKDSRDSVEHAHIHLRQMKIISKNESLTLENVLDRCFANKGPSAVAPTADKSGSEKASAEGSLRSKELLRWCHTLIKKETQKGPWICSECGTKVKVIQPDGNLKLANIVNHVRLHLKEQTLLCRQCDYKCFTKGVLNRHFRVAHKSEASSRGYVDLIGNYYDEIKKIIEGSLRHENKFRDLPDNACMRIRTKNRLRSLAGDKAFLADRQILANRLKENFDDQLTKRRCGLCSRDIIVRNESVKRNEFCSGFMISHATDHLNKPMYYCRVCSKTYSCYWNVYYHLRKVHKKSIVGNYEDRSEKYQSEILDMMTKCFG